MSRVTKDSDPGPLSQQTAVCNVSRGKATVILDANAWHPSITRAVAPAVTEF